MFREEYILVKGSLLLNKVAVLHTLSPKKTENGAVEWERKRRETVLLFLEERWKCWEVLLKEEICCTLCCYSRQEPAFSILFLVPSTLLDCLVLGGAILKHLAVGIDNYVNKCLEVARRWKHCAERQHFWNGRRGRCKREHRLGILE